MTITPELRKALDDAAGAPLRIEDPDNHRAYILTPEERIPTPRRWRPLAAFLGWLARLAEPRRRTPDLGPDGKPLPMFYDPDEPPPFTGSRLSREVPEGIRLADEAFRRDLPAMLDDPKLRGKVVLYHRDKRIAVGRRKYELHDVAARRGLTDDEFQAFYVEPEDEDMVPVTP